MCNETFKLVMENQQHIHKIVVESKQINYFTTTLKLWICEIQNALAHTASTSDKLYIKNRTLCGVTWIFWFTTLVNEFTSRVWSFHYSVFPTASALTQTLHTWKLFPPECKCCIVWYIGTNILEKTTSSIFCPEDGGSTFLWNVYYLSSVANI
jgi:hypothetical protein